MTVGEANSNNVTFANCVTNGEREKIARFMTSFLAEKNNGFVFNVDADWGMGKTFFLKSWHQMLLSEGRISIYIDAWATDYCSEPLAIVVKGIIEELKLQLDSATGLNPDKEREFLKYFYRLLSSSGKVAAGVGTTAVGLGYTAGSNLAKQGLRKIDESIEQWGELQFGAYKQSVDSIDGFRRAIEAFIGDLSDAPGLPVFVFIDELDRCRPDYSIEMLEAIKHLFSISGICFVLGTNTTQLSESIKVKYGSQFNGREYLNRFFSRTMNLPSISNEDYIKTRTDFNESITKHKRCLSYDIIERDADFLGSLFLDERLSPRKIDRIIDQVLSALAYLSELGGGIKANIVTAIMLCITKELSSKEKYDELMRSDTPIELLDEEKTNNLPQVSFTGFSSGSNDFKERTSVELMCNFQKLIDEQSLKPERIALQNAVDQLGGHPLSVEYHNQISQKATRDTWLTTARLLEIIELAGIIK